MIIPALFTLDTTHVKLITIVSGIERLVRYAEFKRVREMDGHRTGCGPAGLQSSICDQPRQREEVTGGQDGGGVAI